MKSIYERLFPGRNINMSAEVFDRTASTGIIIFEIGYNTWDDLKKIIKDFLPNANITILKDYLSSSQLIGIMEKEIFL